MLTSYLIIVVSVPVVGFIPALKHGAFSLTLRKATAVDDRRTARRRTPLLFLSEDGGLRR
jgi:hypothetical protein